MTTSEILEQHDRAPSALVFMARALLPSPGLPKDGGLPQIVQRWTGLRIDPKHLAARRRHVPGAAQGAGVRGPEPGALDQGAGVLRRARAGGFIIRAWAA